MKNPNCTCPPSPGPGQMCVACQEEQCRLVSEAACATVHFTDDELEAFAEEQRLAYEQRVNQVLNHGDETE